MPSADPTDDELISVLGVGLSFPEPGANSQLDPDDAGNLVLHANDLPDMTAGDIIFKFGTADSRKLSLLAAGGETDRAVLCATLSLFDRHRPFHAPVFELSREFGDFWGDHAFPYYIRDDKLVFETAQHARDYFRRAWRFLTENASPPLTSDIAATIQRPEFFSKVQPALFPFRSRVSSYFWSAWTGDSERDRGRALSWRNVSCVPPSAQGDDQPGSWAGSLRLHCLCVSHAQCGL